MALYSMASITAHVHILSKSSVFYTSSTSDNIQKPNHCPTVISIDIHRSKRLRESLSVTVSVPAGIHVCVGWFVYEFDYWIVFLSHLSVNSCGCSVIPHFVRCAICIVHLENLNRTQNQTKTRNPREKKKHANTLSHSENWEPKMYYKIMSNPHAKESHGNVALEQLKFHFKIHEMLCYLLKYVRIVHCELRAYKNIGTYIERVTAPFCWWTVVYRSMRPSHSEKKKRMNKKNNQCTKLIQLIKRLNEKQ